MKTVYQINHIYLGKYKSERIILRHGCFPVNLLHIFRTPFLKNTSGWLLLNCTYECNLCRVFVISWKKEKKKNQIFLLFCIVKRSGKLLHKYDTGRNFARKEIKGPNNPKTVRLKKQYWKVSTRNCQSLEALLEVEVYTILLKPQKYKNQRNKNGRNFFYKA